MIPMDTTQNCIERPGKCSSIQFQMDPNCTFPNLDSIELTSLNLSTHTIWPALPFKLYSPSWVWPQDPLLISFLHGISTTPFAFKLQFPVPRPSLALPLWHCSTIFGLLYSQDTLICMFEQEASLWFQQWQWYKLRPFFGETGDPSPTIALAFEQYPIQQKSDLLTCHLLKNGPR